jgi:tetratricopeptide (TPR) repeat protein
MDTRKRNTWKVLAVCVLIPSGVPLFSQPLIVNYDNNPNLQKAMEYDMTIDPAVFYKEDGGIDMELYRSYLAKANRELAEKHYLAYLEEVKEPFQRVRVYAKLSELYSGGVSPEVAPHPTAKDIEKALEYCRKAMAEAPEAVSFATLSIRGTLTRLPDRENEFHALGDYYRWLLSIDEQKIINNWLPLRPGNDRPSQHAVDDLLETARIHAGGMASNLVDLAVNLGRAKWQKPSPVKGQPTEYDPCYLLEIIEKFPGTKAQELAKMEVAKLNLIIAGEHLKQVPSAEKEKPVAAKETRVLPAASLPQEKPEEAIPTPLASTPPANSARGNSPVPYLIAAGILAVAIMALVVVKGLRKPKSL